MRVVNLPILIASTFLLAACQGNKEVKMSTTLQEQKLQFTCTKEADHLPPLPTRLLPRPRLGDRRLFAGYNVMLGLDEGPVADDLPKTVRIRVGRLRDQAFERKQQQQPVVSDEAESDEGFFVL